MNLAKCMLRKCEQCRYEQSCFKDVENNEYLKNGRKKSKGRSFADFMKEEYKNKTDVYDEIFGKK